MTRATAEHALNALPEMDEQVQELVGQLIEAGLLERDEGGGLRPRARMVRAMEHRALLEIFRDLRAVDCQILTVGQYLRPSPRHHPVVRWVKPDEFVEFQAEAERIGFPGVLAGPLVRSSYRAGRLYQQAIEARRLSAPA